MIQRSREGYRKLLVYQRAAENHQAVLELSRYIPDNIRTLKDLRGHLDTSGRSTPKNIREGWKRRTTDEYLTFIGYGEASNDEVMGDAEDIATGKYMELKGIKGIMGERGWYKWEELEKLKFYPIDEALPPVVKIFLRCKQIDYLLSQLKKSLDSKMDEELTKSPNERARQRIKQFKEGTRRIEKVIEEAGLVRLIDGRVIKREEWEQRVKGGEDLKLFGE